MKDALDRFSGQANAYKKFRPSYPKALYDFLFSLSHSYETAWDCGTGNGQVANQLASRFEKVLASDISETQLAKAEKRPNIEYIKFRAEQPPFANESIDLITVGQAIHWFDIPLFFKEAKRVLKPAGVMAFWGYGLVRVNPEINALIDHFYTHVVGPYWDFERRHVDSHYESIHFDWEKIDSPQDLTIECLWTLNQFEGFFNSWSAVQKYKEQHNGENPVDCLIEEVKSVWVSEKMKVRFPIFIKAGKK